LTTENPASKFLNLERQAELVLEELEKLRDETSNYSTAATGLENAINHISTVSDHLNELSGKIKDVIEILRNIGTPELLANSQAVQYEVQRLKTEVKGLHEESNNVLTSNVDVLRKEIKGLVGEVQSLKEQSSAQLNELNGKTKDAIETIRNIGTPELLANSQAVQDEVKRLKTEIKGLHEESNSVLTSNVDVLRKEIKGLVGEVQSLKEQSFAQLKDIADYQNKGILKRLFGGIPRK